MRTELRASALGALVLLSLAIPQIAEAKGRWSRQLTDESVGDWIPVDPLATPAKRQVAEPRVLTNPAPFQTTNYYSPLQQQQQQEYRPVDAARQLYLQSVPAAQYINHQADPAHYNTNPLVAQAFVPQPNYKNIQYSPFVQHPIQHQYYNLNAKKQPEPPILSPKPKADAARYVDGYRLENATVADYVQATKKKPIGAKKPDVPQKVTERSSANPTSLPVTTVEKEEVQLLYVPLEALQNEKFDASKYLRPKSEAARDTIGTPGQINNQLYTSASPNYVNRQQHQLKNIHQELMQQAYNAQALQGKFKQGPFDRQPAYKSAATVSYPFTQSLYPTPQITTPKSKKLKAHQPPLAIYMVHKPQEKVKLSDVLTVLKEAKDISVLDSLGSNAPKVFVGPSNLRTPEYYSKFELPYLSSIDGNRIQRNVDKLPFFVAPLSYKAPDGFAKIPFPAPHVGSVIVNPFMNEVQDYRLNGVTNTSPNSYSYNSFQNPTTESFRSPVDNSHSSTFNFFPSATPNPVLTHQSTLSNYQSSYSPFEQAFNTFRQPTSSRKPEPVVSTSPRQPLSSYFSSTPSKPTVSYYSFSGPEYSTLPATSKVPSTSNYNNYRGHYITNAAVDGRPSPIQSVSPPKEVNSERPQTTPLPPAFGSHNAYSINHAFHTTEESPDVKNVKANEIGAFNSQKEKQTYNTDSQRPADYSQFSTVGDFSPVDFYGPTSSRPNLVEEQTKTKDENKQSNFSPVPYTTGDDDFDNQRYQTAEIDKEQVAKVVSTTTTSTTTAAPTTKATVTRRPVHLRGRPRYTTQKPDTDVIKTTTTRRTPIRERKPSTFRTRYDTSKTTTTEAAITETPSFESGKKRTESVKLNRYSAQRKPSDEEVNPVTESSLPKTSAANRNQRLRSRGKSHYKPLDDGADYVAKKKKNEDSDSSLAYQRDVLHQNYPVTHTEKTSTSDVHISTVSPVDQVVDLTNGKIKIYETTGSTQRNQPEDNKPSENPLEYYDNQPVFQGESQKYLTDSYYEGSSERTGSTITPELYFNSKDSSTESSYSSSRNAYESNAEEQKPSTEAYESTTEIVKETVDIRKKPEVPQVEEQPTEKPFEPTTVETPVARFRNKLRTRPKFLLASTATKDGDNQISVDTRKRVSDTTESSAPVFTRRNSVQAVTYRPPFDRQRTTMKIEEIEAELKSSRQQLRSDAGHSTTFKYPVYVPQSTVSTTVAEESTPESVTTTKRNHFARRRPVRPTAASSATAAPPASRSRTTTERPVDNDNSNKRVKARGRVRTRATTTTTEKPQDDNKNYEVTEKPVVQQKYASRSRVSAQKYFKKPVTEKTTTIADEEDQAVYDSINRPEYVEYKVSNEKNTEYDPENGKAESHWSPKVSFTSFRPIFNPNSIADDLIKQEGIEYGTKIPDEENDIITARSPYEDVLISVTPATNVNHDDDNKAPSSPSTFYDSFFSSSTTPSDSKKTKVEEVADSKPSSTFESVLEEVMRNLEAQDEDEYAGNYDGPVMKQEVGEIGEIPPENDAHEHEDDGEEDDDFKREMALLTDIRRVEDFSALEDEHYDGQPSTASENKLTTTTERQARRRGVWRKVKVRPVKKGSSFETSESQYYGPSTNDLIKNAKPAKHYENKIEQHEIVEATTESVVEDTTVIPTEVPEADIVTQKEKESESPIDFAVENEETTEKDESESTVNKESEREVEDDEMRTTTDMPVDEAEVTTKRLDVVNVNSTSAIEKIVENSPSNQNTEGKVKVQDEVASTASPLAFWDPKNVISTSRSTEISHETEICYRGRCIKTNKKLDHKKVLP